VLLPNIQVKSSLGYVLFMIEETLKRKLFLKYYSPYKINSNITLNKKTVS